ncbi:hypothetical protein GCM10020254_88300 [Streptomyces goshikiensis]
MFDVISRAPGASSATGIARDVDLPARGAMIATKVSSSLPRSSTPLGMWLPSSTPRSRGATCFGLAPLREARSRVAVMAAGTGVSSRSWWSVASELGLRNHLKDTFKPHTIRATTATSKSPAPMPEATGEPAHTAPQSSTIR